MKLEFCRSELLKQIYFVIFLEYFKFKKIIKNLLLEKKTKSSVYTLKRPVTYLMQFVLSLNTKADTL